MKLLLPALATVFILDQCSTEDETISGYVEPDRQWYVTSINDRPFTAEAFISFPEEGVIEGSGPCNAFTAKQTLPYPWFKVSDLSGPAQACTEFQAEQIFRVRLSLVTQAEVQGGVLILRDDDDIEMVFEAR
ncbi:MAG: META domain-containing protein [Pseudomonadota bacterium]